MANCNQKKSAAGPEQPVRKRAPKKKPSYQTGIITSRLFDDFLGQIASMRERGNLTISGRRIC
jgi:hypothetical protein